MVEIHKKNRVNDGMSESSSQSLSSEDDEASPVEIYDKEIDEFIQTIEKTEAKQEATTKQMKAKVNQEKAVVD